MLFAAAKTLLERPRAGYGEIRPEASEFNERRDNTSLRRPQKRSPERRKAPKGEAATDGSDLAVGERGRERESETEAGIAGARGAE